MQVVNLLLENGARVDVFDHEGKTALHLAAEQGSQEVCKLLLTKNSFVNRYVCYYHIANYIVGKYPVHVPFTSTAKPSQDGQLCILLHLQDTQSCATTWSSQLKPLSTQTQ